MQDFKFIPFQSCVDTSFWVKLNDLKVDEYKLDESDIDIFGFLDICQPNHSPCTIFLDGDSFSKNLGIQHTKLCVKGKLIIKNTLESFNNVNKKELLTTYGQEIYNKIENEYAILHPNLLYTFVILCFADIKKYKYVYWVAIPSMSFPSSTIIKESPCLLKEIIDENQMINLEKQYIKWLTSPINLPDQVPTNPIYFSLTCDNSLQFKIQPLNLCELFVNNFSLANYDSSHIWLGFFDNSSIPKPSDQDKCVLYYPGWLMRNLISLCTIRINKLARSHENMSRNVNSEEAGDLKEIEDKKINIIAFKLTKNDGEMTKTLYSISNASMCYKFKFKVDGSIYEPKYMGWELNQNGQLSPKSVYLSHVLDPIEIASSSAKLNVKLMKWRALPELDLEKIFPLKCLLIGAGTLGCNVARCLLAWGITHITLVDNGTISYSNPVRQSLFTFADALPNNEAPNGKSRSKAMLAAKALAQIFPKVVAKGYDFTVPSPGHPVTGAELREITAQIDLLESLIEQHDALFLLTDSRESRWLPTVIGALYGKVIITTALGFDSFLVMRHGSRIASADHRAPKSKSTIGRTVPGYNLGCYYCNDVIAPTDSTVNRSLDQQCTVTRPGVSYLASGLAVEMFISLVQHPLGVDAPARANAGIGNDCDSTQGEGIESCLGIVPHQIRGFLSTFSTFQPLTMAFDKCTACSKSVLDAYRSPEKMEFLINVFNSPPSFLEDFTGLTELLNGTKANDLMTLSSSSSGSDIA